VAAIALSLASLPFLLPHVLEDFERGIAQRAGLSPGVGAALLGAGLAAQGLGLVLAGRGRRAGLVVTAAAGAVWTLGALWDHDPELFARGLGFRDSARSALWVLGLILTQGGAALSAVLALARGPGRAREARDDSPVPS
jgi:hypothetical protein